MNGRGRVGGGATSSGWRQLYVGGGMALIAHAETQTENDSVNQTPLCAVWRLMHLAHCARAVSRVDGGVEAMSLAMYGNARSSVIYAQLSPVE